MTTIKKYSRAFTLVEVMIGIVILGVVLMVFSTIFATFQKSATQSRQFADSQQNARVAIDYLTENLRQAGSRSDYSNGQRHVAHAGPYQVAINADIDRGETLSGEAPLTALSKLVTPYSVPASGTTIYDPPRSYDSPAETVVLTMDSNNDGVVSSSDRGDDLEESGANPNVYVLSRRSYGFDGTSNSIRTTNLAPLRGPGAYPSSGSQPQPLFQYHYDHDLDDGTPDRLWGDTSGNGILNDAEISSLGAMPDSLLGRIQKIQVTAISEAEQYNPKFSETGGYLSVKMRSEVFLRNNQGRLRGAIVGRVFHDVDGDGMQGPDENGIPNVQIELVGRGTILSNGFGAYTFPASGGTFQIKETDPVGYVSTTSNAQNVSLDHGQTATVNFGDKVSGAYGFIEGTVFEDFDEDGIQSVGEDGIEGVVIALDSGENVATDPSGEYSFAIPTGTYDVTETDPPGLGSTTPNTVSAAVGSGATVVVNFGDVENPTKGTIKGYVFEDDNRNMVRDMGEAGLPGVSMMLSTGDSLRTNATGYYEFSLDPGVYALMENDLSGYVSTTVNFHPGIVIAADTVITINFGDVSDIKVNFEEHNVALTSGAMSLCVENFGEDDLDDTDIILGTPFAIGVGNVLVFHNEYRNSSTPRSNLFKSTASYVRDAGQDVTTVRTLDYSSDGKADVVTGLLHFSGQNVQQWDNDGLGLIAASPDTAFLTTFPTQVVTSALPDVDSDGRRDMVLGLRNPAGDFTGSFQVFKAGPGGTFVPWQIVSRAGPAADVQLGEIWVIKSADFDKDGDKDLVIGSHTSDYTGSIDFYENVGGANPYTWYSRYKGFGAVNDIEVGDHFEDAMGDIDIVVAVSRAPFDGRVYVWHHDAGIFGRPVSPTGFVYPETSAAPTMSWDPGGEVLTLNSASINLDIFPDLFVGTKSGMHRGDLYLVISGDTSSPLRLNGSSFGEVATMDLADFDGDGRTDVVVGTQTSTSLGRLVVFYNDSE